MPTRRKLTAAEKKAQAYAWNAKENAKRRAAKNPPKKPPESPLKGSEDFRRKHTPSGLNALIDVLGFGNKKK